MVKVGDKFKHFDDDFELIGVVKLTGDLHVRNIKNGDEGFMPKKIYYQTQYEQQKQRADELQDIIERFLYANRESDIYAICSEQELVNKYEKIKIKFSF